MKYLKLFLDRGKIGSEGGCNNEKMDNLVSFYDCGGGDWFLLFVIVVGGNWF